MPENELITSKLKTLWIEALKSKSEDSKIYSFLRSKIQAENLGKKEDEIGDYLAGKALARVRERSIGLHAIMTKGMATPESISRIEKEINIIEELLPPPATDSDIDLAINEIIFSFTESKTPLLLALIMRVLADRYAGRYSAADASQRVQKVLLEQF